MRELRRRIRELQVLLKIDYIMLAIVLGVLVGVWINEGYREEQRELVNAISVLSVINISLSVKKVKRRIKELERVL